MTTDLPHPSGNFLPTHSEDHQEMSYTDSARKTLTLLSLSFSYSLRLGVTIASARKRGTYICPLCMLLPTR